MKTERSIVRTSLSTAMAVIISFSTLTYASADSDIKKIIEEDVTTVQTVCDSHTFGKGVVTKEATLKAQGEVTYTCKKCGETKTEKTAKLINIKTARVSGIKSKYKYTGSAVKPAITVKVGKVKLKKGVDYTVSYKNNKKPGQGKIIIKGKGAYAGTLTRKFRIAPAKAAIKSVRSDTGAQAVVKVKAVKGASGYRIAYSENKSFKKVKYAFAGKNKKQATLKGLKGGKTYYVKVQAYKLINGKKCYGAFSKKAKVTVKLTQEQKDSQLRQEVAEYGRSMQGGSYVWGGSSFKATDCSGLTMQCYAKVGISIPHNAAAQASYGEPVTMGAMKAGDLIIMNYGSHAALYIGDGEFVHATNPERGIVVEPVSQLQYYHVDTVRRLI